tara:strand:- start:3198 stop:3410 length:213 start_codon:yes stop_codon:yes gene_type:complete
MGRFKIFDWAGNDKSDYYSTFETFEDAWERLYEEFPEDDEALGEFFVDECESRESRYLDPRDPRNGRKAV